MVSAKAQHPVVSVVMPTYNHAVFIGEAIQSVLSQTFADFELIVVDNYSEDDTESVVRGFDDPRIEYIKFANNGVIAASRNAALSKARGEFVALLDSDDTWSPDKIAVQLEYMRANPNVALICGSMVTRHGNEPFSAVARSSDAVISGYGYNRLLDCNFIFCSSVMVRRAILDSVGVFDESHEMISSEDWDLWMRIARGHRLSLLATQFGSYRIHGSNVSGDARKMGAIESVLRKHLEKRWITVFRLERSMAYFSFGLGWLYIDQAPIEARKMFREALKFADSLSKISWYAMLGLALSFSQSVCRFIKRKLGDRVLKRVMAPREFASSSGE